MSSARWLSPHPVMLNLLPSTIPAYMAPTPEGISNWIRRTVPAGGIEEVRNAHEHAHANGHATLTLPEVPAKSEACLMPFGATTDDL